MGGKEVITLKEVLATMATTAEPFTLRYVKLNEAKGTGGEIVEASGLLQSGRGQGAPALADIYAGQSVLAQEEEGPEYWHLDPDSHWSAPGQEEAAPEKATRAPNHFANMTRNLKSTLSGNFSKVHIWLILEFNGKKVII
jgi:hypothetical protein